MKSKKQIVYLVLLIIVTITMVGIATFAYYNRNINLDDGLPFGVGTANGAVFTASSNGNIALNLTWSAMQKDNASTNVVATDDANVIVTLDSENENETTTCAYDLVWVWDSSDKYMTPDETLPYTKDGVTYNYEISTKIDSKDETDISKFTWNEVDNKYEAVIASKEIMVVGKNTKTITHQVRVNAYNIPVDQKNLYNKIFNAHIEVKNNNCVSTNPQLNITPSYKRAEAVPLAAGALANLECAGGSATYNQKYNQIEISSLTADKTNCTLTYTDRINTTLLTDKVKSLVGKGQVFNEKGYRYEGKQVDNYVWFNNELWRIIGVFGEERHGQTGLELTKIIRSNSLGGLSWSIPSQNNWEEASLNKLLNGAYFNRENGTDGNYCYGNSTVKGDCDYTERGIASDYQNMIKEVTWYLGAADTNVKTTEEMYTLEMGTTGSATAPIVVSTTGKIGLMYPSDYGYAAAVNTNCARTTTLNLYNKCADYNWLYGQGYEWTITSNLAAEKTVFILSNSGNGMFYYTNDGYGFMPVLYLESSVYIIGGTGTQTDPYIIGL